VDKVILVDEHDNVLGEMEKHEAHLDGGRLHRAFSGFVFNEKHELLIQKRADTKYHNPGIWANTVCSHPHINETIIQAANRRIFEELGFHANFKQVGKFIYKKSFPNGMTEHELDHVVVAKYNGSRINPNPNEVAQTRWISRANLEKEITANPNKFAFWLKEILRLEILSKEFDCR